MLQIRVWCLQVPLPGMPPLILAAKAIPNNLKATDLLPYSLGLIKGLVDKKIKVISYACDGTEVERCVQQLIIDSAIYHVTYVIRHPFPGLSDIVIVIAAINGQVVAIIQDAKHGLKTIRNNLFTGAKLLVLGGHVAMYAFARDMAFGPESPLYHRDVEKTDRQDDNAASRLASATSMDYLVTCHLDRLGFIVYLFIFGELIDAYQNRTICHIERIQMVLHARFFVDMWQSFLKATGYLESQYFLSREFTDILRILVNGLISLIIIYRDHLDGKIYPLLPWLHSSETCEHVFAECRKILKDFTYLDFLYMVPRLHALIREAVKFKHSTDPKARASGYAHTYYDPEDANLANLGVFPTDNEIALTAKQAWEEADSLFTVLGVSPSDFMGADSHTASASFTGLPSIGSWFAAGQDPVLDHQDGSRVTDDSEDDEEVLEIYESDDKEVSDASLLKRLIDDEELADSRSTDIDD